MGYHVERHTVSVEYQVESLASMATHLRSSCVEAFGQIGVILDVAVNNEARARNAILGLSLIARRRPLG
jgi:hypothetical protein